ncbi:MAG: hypothetical protein IJM76_00140 [Lachnospiraceae bacterium]|nr:hypothetical protein [Lachnospiraceae bacterium]
MKSRISIILVIVLLLSMTPPIKVAAEQVSKRGCTGGSAYHMAVGTKATLNAALTYGTATTSVTSHKVSERDYKLATTVTIRFTNHFGHSAAISGCGAGSAGVSVAYGTVYKVTSAHDVTSRAYGNWHAELSVTP